jgi:hypothetical protein
LGPALFRLTGDCRHHYEGKQLAKLGRHSDPPSRTCAAVRRRPLRLREDASACLTEPSYTQLRLHPEAAQVRTQVTQALVRGSGLHAGNRSFPQRRSDSYAHVHTTVGFPLTFYVANVIRLVGWACFQIRSSVNASTASRRFSCPTLPCERLLGSHRVWPLLTAMELPKRGKAGRDKGWRQGTWMQWR